MDCRKRHIIDYRQAAERLLVALSFIAGKFSERPVPAIKLCAHAFDFDLRKDWTHEGKRRRIRDAVFFARKLLAERQQAVTIAANGQGYWLTGDAQVMTWYAQQRRRRGLQDVVAGRQIATAASHVGQTSLFPEPAAQVRH